MLKIFGLKNRRRYRGERAPTSFLPLMKHPPMPTVSSAEVRSWAPPSPPRPRRETDGPRHSTLSEARSRLDRSRFSRPNTHFSAFFKIYKNIIFSRANSANFCQKLEKSTKILTFFIKFCKILQNYFQKSAKILQNFLQNFPEMCRF